MMLRGANTTKTFRLECAAQFSVIALACPLLYQSLSYAIVVAQATALLSHRAFGQHALQAAAMHAQRPRGSRYIAAMLSQYPLQVFPAHPLE